MRTQEITNTEAVTNTDSWWKPIDEKRAIIHKFNKEKGLKTIMSGAWTYDKLVQNAIEKLGINFREASEIDIIGLIKLVEE
jgi:uncharacterized hydantoinase/oxoprolinase family protein